MGTSVNMIDRTYGHLAADAEDYERGLLDAFDARDRRRLEVAALDAHSDTSSTINLPR
jgi:hypothetical protein